ncbi:hypothetical protein SNEBB_002608 [Seison nebaliae]|nr:hypothetical protein SNEBB_002608 [Seison nebaliae]
MASDPKYQKKKHVYSIDIDWIESSEICNQIFSLNHCLIGNSMQIYIKLKKKVGKGGQGSVFLISRKRGNNTIFKIMTRSDTMLVELNAMKALKYHPLGRWHTLKFLSNSRKKGTKHMRKNLLVQQVENFKVEYETPVNQYCIEMSYVNGTAFLDDDDYQYQLLVDTKTFYIFVILLLRQVQAIHFTLNEYKIFDMPLMDSASYANSHQDIHIKNIMITNNFYYSAKIYANEHDVVSGFYNVNLRKELKIEEKNIIAKNRLLNAGQSTDFCTLGHLFANIYTSNVEGSRPMTTTCFGLRRVLSTKELMSDNFGPTIKHINYVTNHYSTLRKIALLLELMFSSMLQFNSYKVWIEIVNFFQSNTN